MPEAIAKKNESIDDDINVLPEKKISSVIEQIIPEVSQEKKEK